MIKSEIGKETTYLIVKLPSTSYPGKAWCRLVGDVILRDNGTSSSREMLKLGDWFEGTAKYEEKYVNHHNPSGCVVHKIYKKNEAVYATHVSRNNSNNRENVMVDTRVDIPLDATNVNNEHGDKMIFKHIYFGNIYINKNVYMQHAGKNVTCRLWKINVDANLVCWHVHDVQIIKQEEEHNQGTTNNNTNNKQADNYEDEDEDEFDSDGEVHLNDTPTDSASAQQSNNSNETDVEETSNTAEHSNENSSDMLLYKIWQNTEAKRSLMVSDYVLFKEVENHINYMPQCLMNQQASERNLEGIRLNDSSSNTAPSYIDDLRGIFESNLSSSRQQNPYPSFGGAVGAFKIN